MIGDWLLLYTDEITEAQDPHGVRFSEPDRSTGSVPHVNDVALVVVARK